jgi:hypothetical protein
MAETAVFRYSWLRLLTLLVASAGADETYSAVALAVEV